MSLELNAANVANISEGELAISWNTDKAAELEANDVLFTIEFKAIQSGSTLGVDLNSSLTSAEAYDKDFNIFDIQLNYRSEDQNQLTLFQNYPNPFTGMTNIDFYLPESGNVSFEVFDVTGKLLSASEQNMEKGMQRINYELTQENLSGVLYYKVSTQNETATRKMLKLK